jgi:anhydro-N-acetylmuramic acid kinase
MLAFLARYARQSTRRVVGLMSGTSADGVDAALVAIEDDGLDLDVRALSHLTLSFSPELADEVRRASSCATAPELCALNFRLGEWFAEAALAVIAQGGLSPADVDAIGSHGQTISQLPARRGEGSTLQLAEPSVIAERTGIVTVAEFRYRDVAAGGQGAPLVTYADLVLFRDDRKARAVQNIGGIANVTYLPASATPEQVVAFDTGPGNMVLDGLARRLLGRECDEGGAAGARGQIVPGLLAEMKRHPFLALTPPRSTGREDFGEEYVARILSLPAARDRSAEDLLATATALTADTISEAYAKWLPAMPDEVIVGGGGAHNLTLVRMLRDRLGAVPVRTHEEFGIPGDAKEAMAFALLADATLRGQPGNVPSATGAAGPRVLGKIVPGCL